MYEKLLNIFQTLFFLMALPAFADVSVHGTVRDISGNPINVAQVTVMSEYLVRHITYTDENGEYQTTIPDYPVLVKEQPIETFSLLQNYPNPFNPGTVIPYALSRASQVELTVYSILGQKVRTLVNEYQYPGEHGVYWDGSDENGMGIAAGVYLYTLNADGGFQARKMLLLDGGARLGMGAPTQKTAVPFITYVEEQPYKIMVKVPGYLIYDEQVMIGDEDVQYDVSLEETQDAGTYEIVGLEKRLDSPYIRSYPGGCGTVVLELDISEDFDGTVSLSIEAKSEYNARLTSYVLDTEHPRTECTLFPDVDSNNEAVDSLYIFSTHAESSDTLMLYNSMEFHADPYYLNGIKVTMDPFIEWIASYSKQYSFFNETDWFIYDNYPGYTGGHGAYINDSFEIIGTWGMDYYYRYFRLRPREKREFIFAARQSSVFEEIPVEDFVLEKTLIQGEFK